MEIMTIFIVMLFIAFYLLPSIIANIRHVAHLHAIESVNVLLGWTILGWLAALIWAIAEKTEAPVIRPKPRTDWSEPFYK